MIHSFRILFGLVLIGLTSHPLLAIAESNDAWTLSTTWRGDVPADFCVSYRGSDPSNKKYSKCFDPSNTADSDDLSHVRSNRLASVREAQTLGCPWAATKAGQEQATPGSSQ